MKQTKIIATIGPATMEGKVLREIILNGVNVARINMSHGDSKSHIDLIHRVKAVREALNRPVAILADTKGPEIRIGTIEGGSVYLKPGNNFILTSDEVVGNKQMASISYKNLPNELQRDDLILINDGLISLRVIETSPSQLICKIIHGGLLSSRKGINVPNVNLGMEYLSEVDKKDLLMAISEDVDFVAASFIRSSEDIEDIRAFIDENGGEDIKLIAKIESNGGIDNFEEILDVADGIMVARGDMGVEVPYQLLPGIQKRLMKSSIKKGKPIIVATQMLESMNSAPIPTRAEISDVANAVFDGASCIMLSSETAVGEYPIEAVKAMAKLALQAEGDFQYVSSKESIYDMNHEDTTSAVAHGVCTLAKDIDAKAIIAITTSGYTAEKISKFQPDIPIIGITSDNKTFNQMAFLRGVEPILASGYDKAEDVFVRCSVEAKKYKLISKGDKVVLTAGFPVGIKGTTNSIRVIKVT